MRGTPNLALQRGGGRESERAGERERARETCVRAVGTPNLALPREVAKEGGRERERGAERETARERE